MTNRIRWGILSTANIGRKAVAPAIQSSHNGVLAGIASRDEAKAADYAAEFDGLQAYGSYEALLNDADIDAVYIPLPNSLHREWTIKAAEAGKHILCEKPLALTAQECLEMDESARAKGVKLMEAFMYRFHPRTEKAVELVQTGGLGAVKLLRSVFTFKLTKPDNIRLSAELGGGSLMDVGCYCVNISRTLLGQEPLEVQAFASWGESGVDEEMVATLRFPEDVFAQFSCALTLPRQEHCEVVADEGRFDLASAFLPGTDAVELALTAAPNAPKLSFAGVDEYKLMVEHFADCILSDKLPRYDAREAAANLRVIEALHRSARAGGELEAV